MLIKGVEEALETRLRIIFSIATRISEWGSTLVVLLLLIDWSGNPAEGAPNQPSRSIVASACTEQNCLTLYACAVLGESQAFTRQIWNVRDAKRSERSWRRHFVLPAVVSTDVRFAPAFAPSQTRPRRLEEKKTWRVSPISLQSRHSEQSSSQCVYAIFNDGHQLFPLVENN